ncbi:VOC family protein [Myxococcus sp. AM009]|uniref:VOC family protein n=1 Tax=unclassified Myxococcus TaxID=2648731 RepID=UPI001595A6A4|nr:MULTISPECIES: VOC family protein [unclassified Myxococcus]NVI98682.1 VOC family protein [Myxococcus sp. AM009]NVJ13287.1 VOC family protein [Myxococcus sp. AM010]
MKKPAVGSVGWMDLTVKDAVAVRDFYKDVVGWSATGLDMGGYDDFVMMPPGGGETPAGGICHARGPNADMPSGWMVYITVADLEQSLERVTAMGGQVRGRIRGSDKAGRFCVIEDPSGTLCALYQSGSD